MTSIEIQSYIEQWAKHQNFTAPYGILSGEGKSKNGKKYLCVTFGRARTLDATVEIYNRNFMVLRTNRHGSQAFKGIEELFATLNSL